MDKNNRTFEVPFIPCGQAVDFILNAYKPFKKHIHFFYCGSFNGHGTSTRKCSTKDTGLVPDTFREYTRWISILRQEFDVAIAIQRDCNETIVGEYYAIGVRNFIINDDKLAFRLKDIFPDITLILSITRTIKFDEIMNIDLSCYDYIVLDYWFNRHLSSVKVLPKKYKYVMLVNSVCHYKDRTYCYKHWFNEGMFNQDCFRNGNTPEFHATVEPENLELFDPYIHHYKLQGRETNFVQFFETEFIRYVGKEESFFDLPFDV